MILIRILNTGYIYLGIRSLYDKAFLVDNIMLNCIQKIKKMGIMKLKINLVLISVIPLLFSCSNQDESSNIYSTAPEGAIVLFDGTDFSHWTNCDGGEVTWKIIDGVMEVEPDSTWGCPRIQGIMTREDFKDFHLYLEFKLPDDDNTNSGVYIQRRYEVQILDSYNVKPSMEMGGSLYRQKMPDKIVGKPAGEWETYEIVFRSARFSEENPEQKVENARITVIHNGIVIHNNVIITRQTGVGFPEGPEPAPIMLQDHLALVQFRNIWIMPNEPLKRPAPSTK